MRSGTQFLPHGMEIFCVGKNKEPLWKGSSQIKLVKTLQHRIVSPDLEKGLHYIQLQADCTPIVKTIRIDTKPIYQGDYWIQLTSKQVNSNGKKKYKPLLGVFFPDGTPDLNNTDFALTFDDKPFKLSTGIADAQLPNWIDEDLLSKPYDLIFTYFNLESSIVQEDKWFYYGIDSSWRYKKDFTLQYQWQDISRWKLVRK